MAHQSLYRKYRPQTFDDVVGQEHITRTLRNAVDEDSVSHAYLFCGPRGTGKTTTARILAKALDCEKGPTGEPDDTCESCREIAEGRHPDVYELDAASRTGVDAVRDEIITKVNYAATRGPFKVYIIDEVHMLSTSAFNALLKTLEEPPPHAIFVLAHDAPAQGARDDPLALPALRLPAHLRRRYRGPAGAHRRQGVDLGRGRRPPAHREALRGRDARRDRDARPARRIHRQVGHPRGRRGAARRGGFRAMREAVALVGDRDVAGLFRYTAQLVESGHDFPSSCGG